VHLQNCCGCSAVLQLCQITFGRQLPLRCRRCGCNAWTFLHRFWAVLCSAERFAELRNCCARQSLGLAAASSKFGLDAAFLHRRLITSMPSSPVASGYYHRWLGLLRLGPSFRARHPNSRLSSCACSQDALARCRHSIAYDALTLHPPGFIKYRLANNLVARTC
jgi:hypothetical protein